MQLNSQFNSQFNAQFPDGDMRQHAGAEETMNKPMDDKKIREDALKAGAWESQMQVGILDDGSQDEEILLVFDCSTLRNFADGVVGPLKAELERQATLVQQQAAVIAGLVSTARIATGALKDWAMQEFVGDTPEADRYCEAYSVFMKALAAAAPFLED